MNFSDAPIDSASAARLHAEGLRLDLVDTADTAAFSAWIRAESRGFYDDEPSEKRLAYMLEHAAYRRTTGVWDESDAVGAEPVATVSTWETPLSLPGGSSIPVWAISAVTVAPTHRRRGIARNLLESELRTAHACGVPIAALTASEATIYGRFGFAPSAFASDVTIDTRRARWAGPAASGRVRFTTREELHHSARAVFESARRRHAGEIEADDALWAETCATDERSADKVKSLRAVRYDDASGALQGFAIYRVTGGEDDFTVHTVEVQSLVAATDDAANGLWRFLLELDLVTAVKAYLRPVDDSVAWQLSDRRAVQSRPYDHLWLRVLDPVAALEARTYSAPIDLVLDVADPNGFAEGRMLLSVDESGAGTVTRLDADADVPADAAHLALSVNSLAALYLGATPASTLVRAGTVLERRPGSAERADAAFRAAEAPLLSIWF
ncbi:Predicted acetyltransferase [Paramicrobacterium humi]|uniref:Predicted acetyltransferase n=1 Tax=Paramicrobacterium humi TaxID=640635 RepID=A0A1H4KT27_9MICO|nr:GNAT family N-acetyltransferase [Microbacterium humi]SEB61238.1 Predicted acetyltransferase [Microbacterium humi]